MHPYSVPFIYHSALRAITKCKSSKHRPDTEIIISGGFSESSRVVARRKSTMATQQQVQV